MKKKKNPSNRHLEQHFKFAKFRSKNWIFYTDSSLVQIKSSIDYDIESNLFLADQ